MSEVRSSDATRIAYEKAGNGPPLILVDGALCSRAMGPSAKLGRALEEHFTVYLYDRRGRGKSGDTLPYTVERELEDIEALIDVAGGTAHLFGSSSGAQLALEVAARSDRVDSLVLYEDPYVVDDAHEPLPYDMPTQLEALVAAGRRGDAVTWFMRFVGMPAAMIAVMRLTPPWRKLKAVAHTLPYDTTVMRDHQQGEPVPAGRWGSVSAPTLVLAGGKSPDWLRNGARALADAIPGAKLRVLEGQTHMLKAKVVAPVVSEFAARPEMVDSRRSAA
jgi:pimeloyl-ACP methyl ester carboxylesterase